MPFVCLSPFGQLCPQRHPVVVLQALSNLSPWLHFGQLSPQRAALEAAKMRPKFKESVEGFLEELVSTLLLLSVLGLDAVCGMHKV